MASRKLPRELEEEILSRVPPLSLARSRTVCKQWNSFFNDKIFIRQHLARARPQFILTTKSKFYSVSVILDDHNDPKTEVRELTLDIPGLGSRKPRNIHHCDGLLLCSWNNGAAVFNPSLRQSRWIEPYVKETSTNFNGLGYDYNSNADYKIFAPQLVKLWKFYNFASNAWKDHDDSFNTGRHFPAKDSTSSTATIFFHTSISLNGNLYSLASYKNKTKSFILRLDFSREILETFCDLPICEMKCVADLLVLGVFKKDRFSVLWRPKGIEKIDILVTKNKIITGEKQQVVWINYMKVDISSIPDMLNASFYSPPSYFICDDKTLVMCSCDQRGQAWIYVIKDDKLSHFQVDSDLDPSHCTYFPSLVPVPQGQRQEV